MGEILVDTYAWTIHNKLGTKTSRIRGNFSNIHYKKDDPIFVFWWLKLLVKGRQAAMNIDKATLVMRL